MARVGKPGSIRGEASRRGVSEYQIRKEREAERAAREGRPFSSRRAGGHASNRSRDLANLRGRVNRLYRLPGPTRDRVWQDTKEVYERHGYEEAKRLLEQSRRNTQRYYRGKRVEVERSRYEDIPASLYWYHGFLG